MLSPRSACIRPTLSGVADSPGAPVKVQVAMPVIKALRSYIFDGIEEYPVYLGTLNAEELKQVSAAPELQGLDEQCGNRP